MMELKRNILQYLREWRKRTNRKPLVLRGPRQVGKTTLVRQFSNEFSHVIWLNLERSSDLKYFEDRKDISWIFEKLLSDFSIKKSDINKTLLFIDEIQESPYAILLLRYFYEDYPELSTIAAGSLLEFSFEHVKSMPVGRIEYLYVYPLNFDEYLEALGNEILLEKFNTIPFPANLTESLLKHFNRFVMIGGLPEIVKTDIEKNNLADLAPIYDAIWETYIDDVQKYAKDNVQKEVASYILRTAPLFVDQRVKFQGFGGSEYKSREVKSAFYKLQNAKVIRLIRPTINIDFPVVDNMKKSPRLQFLDTGLVNNALGIQSKLIGLSDLSPTYRGAIIPHMVTQELLSRNVHKNAQPNFWVREKNQSSAEVDLVYVYDFKVIPIEIKSGPKGTLKSLHQFIDMVDHHYAVRIYAGDFKIERSRTPSSKEYLLMNLPYFLGSKIPEYIAYFIENYSIESFGSPKPYPKAENDGVLLVQDVSGFFYSAETPRSRNFSKESGVNKVSDLKSDGVKWPEFIDKKSRKVKIELRNLLFFIKNEPGLKAHVLAHRIDKSIATTERYLILLKKAKLIEFKGAPRWGGYYFNYSA